MARHVVYKLFGIPLYKTVQDGKGTTLKLLCLFPVVSYYWGTYISYVKLFGILPIYRRDTSHYDSK